GVLHEHAAQPGAQVGADHAFDGDAPTIVRAAFAAALHRADGKQRRWRVGCGGVRRDGGHRGNGEEYGGSAHGRHLCGTETKAPPGGRRGGFVAEAAYFRLASIQSTVAWICSSLSPGLPPLGGITPPSGPV